ncbi:MULTISPECIES: hypothetical protein [unclassified Lactococcus]|uniref:hypothetical protein n=1 Tax=unclassified Lactococcus TaxID=2643510 RepID=UPI0011C9F2A9|nr:MULTISPECIES: hypothetical protein [unclassified Lactococcus]MQW23209.1 hypothetical protein [Lactococcus sp. dk101]TXK38120.1 hypothetical protein FVP42_06845 [Lactococcus sp. dk310]TXK49799.1 hypothetical protein FVP43_06815 [Lactococcus sp. dk322]
MNDKEFIEKLTACRNATNELIDQLVDEALYAFPTYAEAIKAVKQGKFLLWGDTGGFIIEEAVKKIEKIAISKPTKANRKKANKWGIN